LSLHPQDSIRFRLTFWYTLTLAVILAASGLFSYYYFSFSLRQQVDVQLLGITRQIDRHSQEIFDKQSDTINCQPLYHLINTYNWDAFIQLRTDKMKVACSSDNLLGEELPFGAVARQQVRWLNQHLESIDTPDGRTQRVISHPIIEKGNLIGVAQIALCSGASEQTINQLRLIYLLVGPFAVIWLGVGCWFLADRTISPIIEITDAAHGINADNLDRRLPTGGHQDELGRMVVSLNRMLERLEDQFRRVRQFSGDASHELRTPLTILRGETEVAMRWAKTPEEFRDMLGSNIEEIDRMERIIENLLTLSKSEVGELPLEIKEFSLSDLIQGLYLQSKILCEPKQIAVRLDYQAEKEILIKGDELRLRQMFLNLISNGIKYTNAGGSLTMRLAVQGDMARVDIADTGIGMEDYHLSRIFDRFYRVDKARNRMDGGTGLGLSIVKWVAEAHGGQVRVTSAPGKGSTFSVLLPVAGPESSAFSV
jgi:heavy metal sensor kinase